MKPIAPPAARCCSRRYSLVAAAAGIYLTMHQTGWHLSPAYHLMYLLLTRTTACFAALYTLAGILILAGRRRAAAASVTQM